MPTPETTQAVARTSASLIVESKVRAFLLDYAAKNRHHKFTRVSRETLDKLNGLVRQWAINHVNGFPSKGSTL